MGAKAPKWRRWGWLAFSLIAHFALGIAAVLYAPAPEPEYPIIPVDLVQVEAEAEAPPTEMLHFTQATHPRVQESVVVPREVLALAPPPVDAVLDASAIGGGVSIDTAATHSLSGFALGGYGGGSAGSGIGMGNGSAAVGTFGEYVGGLRQAGLDVVFVIDASGTMGWVISEVKDRVRDLAEWIRTLVPVTRFGVVAYRDDDDPEFVTKVEPLTLSIARVRRFLDALEAAGRGDLPEGVEDGLRVAVQEIQWKPSSRKVIIVLGDAPPHAEDIAEALQTAQAFRAGGGTVTMVDTSFDANPKLAAKRLRTTVDQLQTIGKGGVMPEFQRIAQAGGGDASTLEGERHVARQLAVLIFGQQWADEVRPLLGNL